VLIALAAIIGVAGGFVGWLFLHVTAFLLSLTLTGQVSWEMPELASVHPGWWIVPIAALGGVIVSLLARWEPLVRGHGIPEAMDAVLEHQSRLTVQAAVAKPVATSVAVGTGAPFGAEGPVIVTGGAMGSLLGQAVRVSPAERKVLLAAGAAAGMAAIFGTPIGAVVLAIELLLFEFSTRALVPLVVASVVADAIHNLLDGPGPFFAVPDIARSTAAQLPFYALLGLVVGLLGALITFGVYRIEDGFARLPIPRFFHPVIGAVGFALIGLVVPRSLGVGYDVIGDALAGRLAVATLAAVFVAKLLAWWIAMGSGTSGSALAPLLLIGATAGGLLGAGLDHLLPGLGVTSGGFALVAMVVTFGAAADAPFTAMVLGFELTGAYELILPLMLAAVIGDIVVKRLLPDSLMTEKLARRGVRVSTDYRVDLLETTLVREAMDADVDTLDEDLDLAEVRERFRSGTASAYPVVGHDGHCVGVVGAADLVHAPESATATARDLVGHERVVVSPDETVLDALDLMVHESVGELPVVEDERVIGLLTKLDVLVVTDIQEDQERFQPGLLGRLSPFRRHRSDGAGQGAARGGDGAGEGAARGAEPRGDGRQEAES